MDIIKISAFSDAEAGGNPAGIVLTELMPPPSDMQQIAAKVGFSETAFAEMLGDKQSWRVRYFSPESEVPFCGHATIALGAALAQKYGDGNFQLSLNETDISVEGVYRNSQYLAALQSPETYSQQLTEAEINQTLALFGYNHSHLDEAIPPAHINGGADHYVMALKSRSDLSAMDYDLDAGRNFMRERGIVTVMLVVAETDQLFHVRNAFASGGVLEDPATGAAAAAFSGYLRDIDWKTSGKITIVQGEDMGSRSLITAEFNPKAGSSIRISGTTRNLE